MTYKEFIEYVEEDILYLRKSRSEDKIPVEEVLKRHEKTIQEAVIKETGHKIPEKNIYREIVSGGEAIEDRPEFIKVLKRLEIGNIKRVWVIDPQRLSRSGLYGAGEVLEAFEVTDTLIATPMKIYDLSNPMDKKYLEMIMIQAAEYLGYSKEVMNRGRLTSFLEGKAISTPPYGYDKEKLKDEKGYKLIPHPIEAEHVKTIFELCIEGVGTTNIANYLNEHDIKPRKSKHWTPATIRDILKNKTYIGLLTWEKNKTIKKLINGKTVKVRIKQTDEEKYYITQGLHEPLVTFEQYELAQETLKNRSTGNANNNGIKNPLNGLVKCGYCGGSMIRRPYTKSFKKNPVRAYKLDKPALLKFLREKKTNTNYSLSQIAEKLDISRDTVAGWFPKKIEKFYPSMLLAEKWFDLKDLLNIEEDTFDKVVTTYKKPDIPKDTLMCTTYNCKCVSSRLESVEKGVIEKLKYELETYQYYLDNYEQEMKKEKISNAKELKALEKKIEELKQVIKDARKMMIRKVITEEEYLEEKYELEQELKPLEERKKQLENSKEEEKIIQYKKSIPILKNVIQKYDTLDNAADKNDLLRSIIYKIEYKKSINGRWNDNAKFQLKVTIYK